MHTRCVAGTVLFDVADPAQDPRFLKLDRSDHKTIVMYVLLENFTSRRGRHNSSTREQAPYMAEKAGVCHQGRISESQNQLGLLKIEPSRD
jgi:hypothetical protein